jgi:hypothetical protein
MSDLIERLEERAAKANNPRDALYLRKAAARIRDLEADLKQHQELNAAEHEFLLQVTAERDAIEAATIRDCAIAAGSMSTEGLGTFDERLNIQMALCLAAERIRALAKPPQPFPHPQHERQKRMSTVQKDIISELIKAIKVCDASDDLLSIIGSYGDTLSDSEILHLLQEYNRTGKVIHERH